MSRRASIIRCRSGESAVDETETRTFAAAGCFGRCIRCHNHALRGCVGRMEEVEPADPGVRRTAIAAVRSEVFDRRLLRSFRRCN